MPVETKKKFVIEAAFYGIILLIVAVTYQYIIPILMPFIIGFCVASVVQVPLNRMRFKKLRYRRWMAILMCVLFYALVVGLLSLFGYGIVTEISNFIKALPDLYQDQLYPLFGQMGDKVEDILAPIDPSLAAWVVELGKTALQNVAQWATDISAAAVKLVASSAASVPGVIVQIIITVVSSFYMSVDYRKILAFIKAMIPQKQRTIVIQGMRYAEKAVLVYIKSYSCLFLVTFMELWLGFLLLKVPYAVALAFGIALFDLMPVLGTGGILLPWTVVMLVTGNFPMAIGIAVLYLVITAVRNTLEPRLVGNQIGLHPLATLIAMILGLRLMGLLGMILFPISLVAATNLRKTAQEVQPAE